MRLPPPDPLSTILLYLAAVIMALEAALKPGAPLANTFPALTMAGIWPFVPIALLSLALVIWIVRGLAHPRPAHTLTISPPTAPHAGEPASPPPPPRTRLLDLLEPGQAYWLVYMGMYFLYLTVTSVANTLKH